MTEISAIKVVAPNVLQKVVDDAIQIHGGAGVSQDTPLTGFFAQARSLRLADGPDEVHKGLIARIELAKRGHSRSSPGSGPGARVGGSTRQVAPSAAGQVACRSDGGPAHEPQAPRTCRTLPAPAPVIPRWAVA